MYILLHFTFTILKISLILILAVTFRIRNYVRQYTFDTFIRRSTF